MAQHVSRKRRKHGRRAEPVTRTGRAQSPQERMASRYERSRARDEAARAALEPLAPGERPNAVTVAAIIAFALGVLNAALYAAGLEIRGERPQASVLAYSGLTFLLAWGMWGARYWAVLVMQALLGIAILYFSMVVLFSVEDAQALLIAVAVIGSAGTLFWFLVKAMARIQAPRRP